MIAAAFVLSGVSVILGAATLFWPRQSVYAITDFLNWFRWGPWW